MKRIILLPLLASVVFTAAAADLYEIGISNVIEIGNVKPIPVSLSGFTGEAAEVIQFDLYVQGFTFTTPDVAQFLISGSNSGDLVGRASDRLNKSVLVNKSYTGASLRRQAHAFTDDFLRAIRLGIEWAIEKKAVFDLLCHPSVLYPNDPEFKVVELVCELVKKAGDRAAIVDLDTIAMRAETSKR